MSKTDEFLTFKPETQHARRRKTPKIILSTAGAIFLNKDLVEKMGLAVKDRISIHQSKANSEDWYIEKTADGFELRLHKDGCLKFNSASTCKAILASVEATVTAFTFPVSLKPEMINGSLVYPIITAYYKQHQNGRKEEN